MATDTLVKSYMLWVEKLDDKTKMQLALALLNSIELPEPKKEQNKQAVR